MTLLADRVKETSATTGTSSIVLAGAAAGFRSFVAGCGVGSVYYAVVSQVAAEWEVGLGTLTASPDTIARTTVLSSSNAGALTNFTAGIKDVFCTAPATIFGAGDPGWSNLRGQTTSTTFAFTADRATLVDPTGGSQQRATSVSLTNTITSASALNGTDGSALANGQFLHFYAIGNGSTVASVCSTVAPPTGPTTSPK